MKKIYFAKPSITDTEIDYVNDAIRNGWGDDCYGYLNKYELELKSYFGVSYAWPTSSCHGALHIILMALGVGPGDEVIVPDLTWIGSVSPVSWLGATPIFADVDKVSICLDPDKAERAITSKTKAIIVVHPYGNVAEMERFMEIGRRHNLPIIEDAAEAVGSEYKGRKAGSIGDFGVISTHGTKMLTTGEGGAILTSRSDYVEKITTIESQGRMPGKHIQFWVDELGLKYKMSNIQAALGLAQLERADDIVGRRREIFSWYSDELSNVPDITINPEPQGVVNSYWQPTVVLGNSYDISLEIRNQLIADFNVDDIALRPLFYPVSKFPMYVDKTSNEVSWSIFFRGFNLPSYYALERKDVAYVCERFKRAISILRK